jgi:hypothetical protein
MRCIIFLNNITISRSMPIVASLSPDFMHPMNPRLQHIGKSEICHAPDMHPWVHEILASCYRWVHEVHHFRALTHHSWRTKSMNSFRQCQATRADAERCQRKAQDGRSFCHSHKRCTPPDLKGLVSYPDVGLHLSEGHSIPVCADCQEAIFDDPVPTPNAEGQSITLCSSCYNKRQIIAEIIFEMIDNSEGLSSKSIFT